MINLKNINIEFDHKIINNGEILIPDASLTAIVGKSGCGKTSLLYLIGLIATNEVYEYTFDENKINLCNDSEISRIRKEKIGFIFQDNTLIESLSVKDNIYFASKIAGKPASDLEIENYLKFVELEIDSNVYPKQLSGGEQQRVAIACAIAKTPDLIIADEPTSALDKNNADMVLKILLKYAHELGNKVVIATHNEEISCLADCVYAIIDQKIINISCTAQISKDKIPTEIHKRKEKRKHSLGGKFYFTYIKRTNGKKQFQRNLILILCAISISFAVAISTMGEGFLNEQSLLMNQISNREVFLVNQTVPSNQILAFDENLSITDAQKQSIEKISNIDVIYPYFEFKSLGYLIDKGEAYTTSEITIYSDSGENSYVFDAAEDSDFASLTIAPYYQEQSLDKQLSQVFDNNEKDRIYLTSQLAKLLGVNKDSKNISLTVTIGVPVKTTIVTLNVNNESNKTSNEKSLGLSDVDCSVSKKLDLKISGVLNQSMSNNYTVNGNNIIYMPIDSLTRILNEVQNDYNNQTQAPKSGTTFQEWQPSAYMIYAKSYNEIDAIINKTSLIDSNFACKSRYQDIDSMNQIVGNIKRTMIWISVIIILVLILLMTIIFTNYVLSRKFEIAVLKANGLNKNELLKIILSESLIQIFLMNLTSLFASAMITFIVNKLFNIKMISFDITTVIMLFSLSIIALSLPVFCSAISMIRVKPDKVFRN